MEVGGYTLDLYCDVCCGASIQPAQFYAQSRTGAWKLARLAGWRRRRDFISCPLHRKEPPNAD